MSENQPNEKALARINDGKAVAVMSYAEKKDLAKVVAMAKICEWSEAQVLVMGMKAIDEGLTFLQALDHFDIIMGKPSRKAISMEAKYRAAGGRIKFLQRDAQACIAEFCNPDGAVMQFSWTRKDADTYMVYEKGSTIPISKKGNWQGDKKLTVMLCWRTIAEGCRAMMPEAFLGVYISDEVEEQVGEIVGEVEVHEPGGTQSESFAESAFKKIENAEVMWTDEQKDILVSIFGNGKVLPALRKHFNFAKSYGIKDVTYSHAQELIEAAKEEARPTPAPETPPEKPTEAAKEELSDQQKVEQGMDDDDDDIFSRGEMGK